MVSGVGDAVASCVCGKKLIKQSNQYLDDATGPAVGGITGIAVGAMSPM